MADPSFLCIHGGAQGAWVWDTWRRSMSSAQWEVNVLDLRGHGRSLPVDLSLVTMDDYVADVDSVAGQITSMLGSPPILMGCGMGGLIALMQAARTKATPAAVLFSPSLPLEVGGRAAGEQVRITPSAPFGPELYGIFPDDPERSRGALFDLAEELAATVLERSAGALESGFARRQRQRGVSVPAADVRCPVAIISGGREEKETQASHRRLADYLSAEFISLPDLGRWGMLYDEPGIATALVRLQAWLKREQLRD